MKLIHVLSLIVAAFIIAACQSTGATVKESNTIEVGGLFALTSFGNVWGIPEKQAIELAFEQANERGVLDKKLHLISEDTQTDPAVAVAAFNKLVSQDDVKIILGPTWEASSTALVPLADEKNLLLIAHSSYKAVKDQQSTHMFSTYPPYYYEIDGLAPYFEEKNIKNFAVIYNQEIFSTLMKDFFISRGEVLGWSVDEVYSQSVEDKDYRPILLKIKQNNAVQALYLPVNDNDDRGLILRQMSELGLDVPVFGTSSSEVDAMLTQFGTYTEDALFYAYPVDAPGYKDFESAFVKKYGEKPSSPSAANAYDSANLLIAALESGAATTEEIATYLHSVQNYPGASGVITFDENGIVAEKAYVTKTVRDGSFVIA